MRILIADDDPVSNKLLERTLIRLGHEPLTVNDGLEAVNALLPSDGPRMAILDWMMPGADGLTVCRTIRERHGPYVYVILLSARDRREDIVAGLDAGADDFLTKPYDAEELRSRLRSGTRVLELQEGLLKAQAALNVLATQDELTGIWNRRRVMDHLEGELRRANHERRPLAIAILDVDHFKKINDTHGHPVGDVVLREIALRLHKALRDYDAVGRYGGEEFLVVLPGCNREAGLVAAERLRAAVAAAPILSGDETLDVRVSVGLAWTEFGEVSAPDLIRRADDALYRAKAKGRNCVTL